MIRESEHFFFNGRKSTDFKIRNVKIGGGAYEESIASGKTILESYPNNAFKPTFHGTHRELKEFEVSFYFDEIWDNRLMDEIIMWLNVDEYKKLFFEANIDRVFYAMPISDLNLIHNGLQNGYVTMTMRCDSAYSFSHKITTLIYDTSISPNKPIELKNFGHFPTLPNIWIKKISEGDIFISNLSNKNLKMEFKNIDLDEKLTIKGHTEIIKTSKENTERYDDFNDIYLELVYGVNRIQTSSNILIKFEYEYIFS